MIDLHNHILPGLDDGSSSLAVSVEMARVAAADGITHIACTPHISPGVYNNDFAAIRDALQVLLKAVNTCQIEIGLSMGADIHVVPDLVECICSRKAPTLNNTRYFLLEPPHHVCPPGLSSLVENCLSRGYVPIITHPERLAWIDYHYDALCEMQNAGALLQVTAGSISGSFGRRARYWSERMLEEGRVDLIATDAHHFERRPPILSRARDIVSRRMGERMASRLTLENPGAILADKRVAANGVLADVPVP